MGSKGWGFRSADVGVFTNHQGRRGLIRFAGSLHWRRFPNRCLREISVVGVEYFQPLRNVVCIQKF
jgi:hypothetical protein